MFRNRWGNRTQKPIDVIIARWLLAFTCYTTFAIEHVYGHHRHVGTLADPATARRDESLMAFWVRSSVNQIIRAFRFEAGISDRTSWACRFPTIVGLRISGRCGLATIYM